MAPTAMAEYAKRMLDAVSEFERIGTVSGVTDKLEHILSSFGFTAFLVTGVPEPPLRLEEYILMNGWPAGWTEHYVKRDFYRHDPVAALCRTTSNPFEWSEVEVGSPSAAEVMDTAYDFGMRKGFLVPIMRTSGFQACVTMAGERPDLDPDAKRVLHVVSMFAHGRIANLNREPVRLKGVLTKTEKEILQWTAVGKSSWEIGLILNLSKSTVDTFAKRATAKLDAVNRTQAVVNAIRTREISL